MTRPSDLPLVLASRSPRRAALLAAAGLPFERGPHPVVDETPPPGLSPVQTVMALAERKARDVASRLPGRLVLAADTLVFLSGLPLGKPRDAGDARRMLRLLSGRSHEVATGVALARGGRVLTGADVSVVRFRALTAVEIDRYVAGGEPFDKAGAYAIQGGAASFVEGVEGEEGTVVGLPLRVVRDLLAQMDAPAADR